MESNRRPFAARRTFAVAVAGFIAGLFVFALTGYRFFGSAPPPLFSAFSSSAPLAAFFQAFAHEAFFILGMGLSSLLLPTRALADGFLFVRGLFLAFSASYLYGTSPTPGLYLAYLFPSACLYIAEAALCELCAARPSLSRRKRLALALPAFCYYSGMVFCLCVILHLLLALCGR